MAQIYSQYAGPPLRANQKEIRVLELLPLGAGCSVEASCRLQTVSLLHEPKPHYSALSYVWGDSNATKPILLNGKYHNVTNNLAAALKFLTGFHQDRLLHFRLWVDAICINQHIDPRNHEKNEQVAMMGDVFANADQVICWLGDNVSIPKPFNTLVSLHKEFINSGGEQDLMESHRVRIYSELYGQDDLDNEKSLISRQMGVSIRDFVELPYWSRMWIFQEIVLAEPGKIVFLTPAEPCFISGDDLRLALGLIDIAGQRFHQKTDLNFISGDIQDALQAFFDLGNACKYINRVLVARQHLHEKGLSRAERATLCILSAFGHNTRATNPLDYYYSILGVSQLDLKPNYDATNQVETVCIDFISAYLDATRGSPDTLLFLHDALGSEAKAHHLPSWAPHYHLQHTIHDRDRGIDYEAAADCGIFDVASSASSVGARLEGLKLIVDGIRIGAVNIFSDQLSENLLRTGAGNAYLSDFERRHKYHYATGISCATAYYSTLMMDHSGGQDGWKSHVSMQLLSGISAADDAQERVSWWTMREAFVQSIQDAIWRRENEVLKATSDWSRTLSEQGVPRSRHLFEFEGGYLGLALQGVQIGDIICVLNGSRYPIILRPLPGDLFEFVATCFVLGLMKGEAKSFESTGKRVFRII